MLDDPGRVNVAILNRPAAGAVVDAVGQRLRRHPSAAVAFLGSPSLVDLRSDATGTFRLMNYSRQAKRLWREFRMRSRPVPDP